MYRSNIHKVLTSLNSVCKVHASLSKGRYPPKVNIEKQSVEQMNIEITKLMNYLKHPQYSYLNK
jgi:hypothetical protein